MSKEKAKEKALELVENMNIREHKYANASYTMTEYQRIQCAIVHVNYVLEIVRYNCNDKKLWSFYWEVLEELEAMLAN